MCEDWYTERRYSKIETINPDPSIFPDYYKSKRFEIILKPGEMVFIPAGMFHFIFSEDSDPETKLCASINFWYNRCKQDIDKNKASIGWHDIHLKFNEILEILNSKESVCVTNSPYKVFPPTGTLRSYYPEAFEEYMSFDCFYKSKNPKHYIAQFSCVDLNKFSIPYKSELTRSSLWINWGNCNTLPHYDGMDNWLCQLKGTRRVILIPHTDRNLLYTFNPYPNYLLRQIYNNCLKQNYTIHHEESTLDSNIIKKLLEPICNYNEYFVDCSILEQSYKNEIDIISDSNIFFPSSNPKKFKIKKYFINDTVSNLCDIGILWFLTQGRILINNRETHVSEGATLSFPSLCSVRILTECVIITPYIIDEDYEVL
jgi:hypothetical protein